MKRAPLHDRELMQASSAKVEHCGDIDDGRSRLPATRGRAKICEGGSAELLMIAPEDVRRPEKHSAIRSGSARKSGDQEVPPPYEPGLRRER